MAAIFPKSSDLILKIVGAVVGLGAVVGVAAYTYYTYPTVIDTGYQPVQPVPYSHKLHAGQLGLDCFYCHSTVYKAAYAAIPPTETCMNCHTKVKPDSPRLEWSAQSFATGQPIPWIKIHRLPDFVYFNHQSHVPAGVSCVSCHGRIDQMIEVHQEKPLNMAILPGVPSRSRSQDAAGGTGDQARLGSGPRSARNRRTRLSRRNI